MAFKIDFTDSQRNLDKEKTENEKWKNELIKKRANWIQSVFDKIDEKEKQGK